MAWRNEAEAQQEFNIQKHWLQKQKLVQSEENK